LTGTVLFNINTMDAALTIGARPEVVDTEVWVPDIVGSFAFLVSSAVAIVPEVRTRRHSHAVDTSRRIAFLNLTGSVLFSASAVCALVLRSGTDVSLAWADMGTFCGALCFLVAAWLFGGPPRSRTVAHAGTSPTDRPDS
jgi:urea transporter